MANVVNDEVEIRDLGRVCSHVEIHEESYWQPMPTNGFVRCHLESRNLNSTARFSMGIQVLPAGGAYARFPRPTSVAELEASSVFATVDRDDRSVPA